MGCWQTTQTTTPHLRVGREDATPPSADENARKNSPRRDSAAMIQAAKIAEGIILDDADSSGYGLSDESNI